VYNTP
ncbi:hypothetical protein EC900091_4358, partial [Escherichia coli 90.0091]